MNTGIIKYEPLHIVKLFNGELIYIQSEKVNELLKLINSNKFIKIKNIIINTASIDVIKPAGNDINQLESKLYHIENESIKEKIRQTVFIRKKENSHKTLTDGVLENIILEFNK